MKRIGVAILIAAAAGAAWPKLPAPSDDAKAKAAEAAAKTAWTDKVAAFQLCKSQDKVAAAYRASAMKAGKDAAPLPTPPCADPGPFSYSPAAQPLEGSGAHSPPGTAKTPPSQNAPAAAAPKSK